MKRIWPFIFLCVAIVIVGGVVYIRSINGNKPKADILGLVNDCDPNKAGDCAIDLVVVNVDKPGGSSGSDGYINAYNKEGKSVASGVITLASDTFTSIGQESEFAEGNSMQMTPLGVYNSGEVWASTANDPDGYKQHSRISPSSTFGSLFIELSGNPIDGGAPLCGLNDPNSANCRHIGIHSGANLNIPTHGCIKTDDNVVRKIAKNLNGAKVIITDIELAGDAAPVDFESYDPNYTNPVKINKTDWNPSFEVTAATGQTVGKVHDYGRWWLSETAKPTGKYYIKAGASGYLIGETSVEYVRETGINGAVGSFKEKIGGTSIFLGLPLVDGNYSRYFNTFNGNGYENQLRFSAWDTSYTNQYLPDPNTGALTIPVSIGSPICNNNSTFFEITEINRDCLTPPVSSFVVYAVTTPWHDLGYGDRNGLGNYIGPEIATFNYDYSNPTNSITLRADLSKLSENQKKAMYTWGIAITQKRKLNHNLNDWLFVADNHRCNVPINDQTDSSEQTLVSGESSATTSQDSATSSASATTPLVNPTTNETTTPGLFQPFPAGKPASWDPLNLFNTASSTTAGNTSWNSSYDEQQIRITAVQPEKYVTWTDYLNPYKWFAPEPGPAILYQTR